MRALARFLALLALLVPAIGHAQSYDGGGPLTPSWVASPTNPTGSAPADAIEPADVADSGFTESAWILTTDGSTDYIMTAGAERKFRVRCEPSDAVQLDPILYPGQAAPVGHPHQFTGRVATPDSTFATNRASPSSRCSGGPLFSTAYWEPEVFKTMPNGLVVGVKHDADTFYYVNGLIGDPNNLTYVRANTAFIGGANPSNYNDTAGRAEYAAAGLMYPGGPDTPAGSVSWQCYAGSDLNTAVTVTVTASRKKDMRGTADSGVARHLRNAAGQDPWGGNCTGSVASPGMLIASMVGPDCWNRTDLRATDGRGHTRYSGTSSDNAIVSVCPNNWAHWPQLATKKEFHHTGFSDYGTWYYGSDRMRMATTECPDAAAACDGVSGGNVPATVGGVAYTRVSLDPCRAVSVDFCPGSTGHFDWLYGAKRGIFDEMQRECLGITVRGVAPTYGPAECNTSQISRYRKMRYGGTSPDSAMSGGCTVINSCDNAVPGNVERYNPLPAGTEADITVTHH